MITEAQLSVTRKQFIANTLACHEYFGKCIEGEPPTLSKEYQKNRQAFLEQLTHEGLSIVKFEGKGSFVYIINDGLLNYFEMVDPDPNDLDQQALARTLLHIS